MPPSSPSKTPGPPAEGKRGRALLQRTRDAVADKRKQPAHEPAAVPSGPGAGAAQLPALGGSGLGVVGGLGDALASAARRPPSPAAELARLRALPPGDPERVRRIKPEALKAEVPEGAGATGALKQEAADLPAASAVAPAATVGASSPAVATAPAGANVAPPDAQLARTAPPSPSALAGERLAAQRPAAPGPVTATASPPPAPAVAVAAAPQAAPAGAAPTPETRPALPETAGAVPVARDQVPAHVPAAAAPTPGVSAAPPAASQAPAEVTAAPPATTGPTPAPAAAAAPQRDVAVATGTEPAAAPSPTLAPLAVGGALPAAIPAREPAPAAATVQPVKTADDATADVGSATSGAAAPAPSSSNASAATAAAASAPGPAATQAAPPPALATPAPSTSRPAVAVPTVGVERAPAVADAAAGPTAAGTPVPAAPAPLAPPVAVAGRPVAKTTDSAAPTGVPAPGPATGPATAALQAPTAPDAAQVAPVAAPDGAAPTVAAPSPATAAPVAKSGAAARPAVADDPNAARAAAGQTPLTGQPAPRPQAAADGAAAADGSAVANGSAVAPLSSDPAARVQAMLGSGHALAPNVREKAERSLGTSLAGVRVHEGAAAEALSSLHGARAFAQGSDVVLGAANALPTAEREAIIAEELVHVAQMGGRTAADRGATGRSAGNERDERTARSAARDVAAGERVGDLTAAEDEKALYRNDGPAPTPQPSPPDRVQLRLAGKPLVVRLPRLAPGTTQHMATLPEAGIPGLKLERQVLLRFSAATGQFIGGTAWTGVALGKVVRGQSIALAIAADGSVATALPQVSLVVPGLLDVAARAEIVATGPVAQARVAAADLRRAKLQKWLRDGFIDIQVDPKGTVSGSGTLGLHVPPLGDGELAARVEQGQLLGTANVRNATEIPIGKAVSVQRGLLTGTLGAGDVLDLAGSLAVDFPALGRGSGQFAAHWTSSDESLSGGLTFAAKSSTSFGKLALSRADVSGTVVAGQLTAVSGSGSGVWDNTYAGTFQGALDLETAIPTVTLSGGLVQPIVQGEARVAKGVLQVAIADNAVTAVSGQADFALGAELTGKATLEAPTSPAAIHASAVAGLVAPRRLGDVTVAKGGMQVKVLGGQVEIIGGQVDFTYRDTAKGALQLAPSPDARLLSGTGTARTARTQTWGDIAVQSAAFDVHVAENGVAAAEGRAEITWAGLAKGQIAFDATRDFSAIDATATATLYKGVALQGPLHLLPDDASKFNLTFTASRFKELSGQLAWQHEGFRGVLHTAQPLADLRDVTGEGKADVGSPFPIAESNGVPLLAETGSQLLGQIDAGRFSGVRGTLNWRYANWLAGTAQIPTAKSDIHNIDGTLQAQVIAAQPVPGHPDVVLQPGDKGALAVAMVDSKPQRYSGKLGYLYQQFLRGEVVVAGEMLHFGHLQGQSRGQVVAEKALPNATLLPGGQLAVEFVDSEFNALHGTAAFRYADWLQGVADIGPEQRATLRSGLAGPAEGTLTRPLPGEGEFSWHKGGTARITLAPGVAVNRFAAGSSLNWRHGKVLGGTVTLAEDASLRGPTATSPASVLKRYDLTGDPKVSLLPSAGLEVDFAAGAVAQLRGTAAAELQGWAKGTLAISAGSAATVTGAFQGAVSADRPLGASETTLVAGGHITVPVHANQADGLSGKIPVRYGTGSGWLRGTVNGETRGAGIDSLSGEVAGGRITAARALPGGLTLQPGGNLRTAMTASHIDRLGGEANWEANDPGAPGWIGGIVAIDPKSSTTLIDGEWQGNIQKQLVISSALRLLPGGNLRGQMRQNAVTQLAGDVAWQYEDWLRGAVHVSGVDPHQVDGTGPAQIVKQIEIVPGKLAVTPGGAFSATLVGGQLTRLAGDVPFLWQDWLAGSVRAEAGTRTQIAGPAEARVVGAGTSLGPVRLLPGGQVSADLSSAGVDHLSGELNVAYGSPNDGAAWHVEGQASVQAASGTTFRGAVAGRLASERKLPGGLTLQQGGQLGARVDGAVLSALSGRVGFSYAPGGQPLVAGAVQIAAGSTAQEISGSVAGTVSGPIDAGNVRILPGGAVAGEITRNLGARWSGTLAAEVTGIARGRLEVAGEFDPQKRDISGELQASLLADQGAGPLVLEKGSGLGARLEHNEVAGVWGKLAARTGDFRGVVDVPKGAGATLSQISGEAELGLLRDKPVGGAGLVVRAGSAVRTAVTRGEPGTLRGDLHWQFQDWLGGEAKAELSPDAAKLEGIGTAQVLGPHALGPLTLQPGGHLRTTLQGATPTQFAGDVAWTWGAEAWLRGTAQVMAAGGLERLSGTASATLAVDKRLGEHVVLVAGGDLQTRLEAGQPGRLSGTVALRYDDWLTGALRVKDSDLTAISGQAKATLLRHQAFGALTLRRGGALTADLRENTVQTLSGQADWQLGETLEGSATLAPSSPLALTGTATARLRQVVPLPGGVELQRGGALAAALDSSRVTGLTGEVGWRYAQWLEGRLALAAGQTLESPSGEAVARVAQSRTFGQWTLLPGGALQATLAGGRLTALDGEAAMRWQDWLDARVELAGTAAGWSGEAAATVRTARAVGAALTLERGGDLNAAVDAKKPLDESAVSGRATVTAAGWLRGEVNLAPAPLTRPSGQLAATLLTDKVLGETTLRRGGQVTAELRGGEIQGLAGDVNWQHGVWLGGTLHAQTPAPPDKLSGQVTATLLAEKPMAGGVKLLPGGQLRAQVANGKPSELDGIARFSLGDWLTGTIRLQPTASLEAVSGTGAAQVVMERPVGSAGMKVRPGSQLQATLAAGELRHVAGGVKWQLGDWLAGTAQVDAESLQTLDGEARARLLVAKPLPGGGKLLPGGAAELTLANGEVQTWGGTLGWQYADWLGGRLEVQTKAPLAALEGKAEARLLVEKPLPGGLALLRGSALDAQVVAGKPVALSGEVRVRYGDWLEGAMHVSGTGLDAVAGELRAQVVAPHAAGAGVTLQRGGAMRVTVHAGEPSAVQGQIAVALREGGVEAEAELTAQPSPLTALTGVATGRLTAPTRPVQETRLLPGGTVELAVSAGRPVGLGGRLEWQHGDWLAGTVQLASHTPIQGPWAGEAEAELRRDKALGTRAKVRAGGHLKLQLQSGQAVAQNQVRGAVGVQFDDWLSGSLQLKPGATLAALSGSAELALIADKAVSPKVTFQKGGLVRGNVEQNAVTELSGLVVADYERWLAGSVQLEPTASLEAASGAATLQLRTDRAAGALRLLRGGDVRARLEHGELARFGGLVDWHYEDWLRGNLTVDGESTLHRVSGTGAAVLTAPRAVGGNLTLLPGGHARAVVADNQVAQLGGDLSFAWDKWLAGHVQVTRASSLATLAGEAEVQTREDKPLGPNATLLRASRAEVTLADGQLQRWRGAVGFRYSDFVEGRLRLDGANALAAARGEATVNVVREKPLTSRVELQKGGTLDGRFSGEGLDDLHGSAALRYDKWLTGTLTAEGRGGLSHLHGHAALRAEADRRFGLITLRKGSALDAEFADNEVALLRGNVDVTLESWLAGNLRFAAQDLNDVSGEASLAVTKNQPLAGPLTLLQGSQLRGRVTHSALEDFAGSAKVGVRDWGTGELAVRAGSTRERVAGSGRMDLTAPKRLGSLVTLTRASLGAEVDDNQITSVWGRGEGEVSGFGSGWVAMERGSRMDAFDGQAGIKLTTPRKVGRFAELSGGEVIANFRQNALVSFGGKADVTVYGWGKGSLQIDAGSTLESLNGVAQLQLTEPRSLAGGKVRVTGGEVSAVVAGQTLAQVAGNIEVELPGIARGKLGGSIDLARNTVSGQGTLQQIRAWKAGPATVTDATLSASVVEGRLAAASGSARIDAGKVGKGTFQVNYEDTGSGPLLYGQGELRFQPHERVDGTLAVQVSREQALTGRGEVDVRISEKIRGKAAVALDADGHVQLAGEVTIPGPFELFKPEPWKKDLKLLDASFLVYTPPTVKVKVGAGMGLAVGLRPLTLRNLAVGGRVDLMDPGFAAMSVSGQLSSAAYADLNLYVEGSVQVSALVVAVQAGLRAALNLHLEAAVDAQPVMTVNRRGLGFDMPIDARLSAALNLILTFFAKVKVGVDLGVVSVMETVWHYDKSPDPLKLAEFSLGAHGRVAADAAGMRGSVRPEYKPPDLSIASLKKALRL